MTAILTDCRAVHVIDDPLLLRLEQLDDQRGHGEKDPFDRDPPPADEQPPRASVMDVL